MTTANVERLRAILAELFAGRTLGPEVLADDAEWINPHDAVEPGTRSGAAAFNGAIVSVFSTWDDVAFELERVIDHGDQVLALGMLHGTVQAAGMRIDSPHAQLWTFRGALATRMCWFNDHREALEAAGLADRG